MEHKDGRTREARGNRQRTAAAALERERIHALLERVDAEADAAIAQCNSLPPSPRKDQLLADLKIKYPWKCDPENWQRGLAKDASRLQEIADRFNNPNAHQNAEAARQQIREFLDE